MTEPPSNAAAPPVPPPSVPPPAVLDAFGIAGVPVPLTGGQGQSVRVGGFVFKPTEATEDEVEWAASLFERLTPADGFRVPQPLRAADGRSVVEGWTAHEFLTGEAGPRGRWTDVLDAGRAFHAALREEPRPAFLGRHTHPWAVADRVAWGEQDVEVTDDLAAPFAALLELRRPLSQDTQDTQGTAQLIHGDLTGNVLFAPDAPPTVIDFSPYWRPPAYAEAIVLADGLLWFDLPPELLLTSGPDRPDRPDRRQLLIRALLFRLVAHSEAMGPSGRATPGEAKRYARATDIVVRKPNAS